MENYFLKENDDVRIMFDLDDVLEFQLNHDVQVIRGDDFQYACYINHSVYATGLTPMFALTLGIHMFKKEKVDVDFK